MTRVKQQPRRPVVKEARKSVGKAGAKTKSTKTGTTGATGARPNPKRTKARPVKPRVRKGRAASPAESPSLSDQPTQAELARAYKFLLEVRPLEGSKGGHLLFYEACFADDDELERVFEAWADRQDNPLGLPLDLLEDDFASAGRFPELYGFVASFSPVQLGRAVLLMRSFLVADAGDARYERTAE